MELGNLYIEKLMLRVLDLTKTNLQLETQLQFAEHQLKEAQTRIEALERHDKPENEADFLSKFGLETNIQTE